MKLNYKFIRLLSFSFLIAITFSCSCNKNKNALPQKTTNIKSLTFSPQVYKNLRKEILNQTGLKGELKHIIDRKIINICLKENNYPFSYRVEKKEDINKNYSFLIEGFEVDIARKIAQILDVKANIIFSKDDCDLIFNPPNPQNYLLSEPYFFQPSIFCEKKLKSERCKPKKIKGAKQQISKDWFYIGIKKGEKELKQALDLIIENLYESETYHNIFKKWFK